MDNWKIGMFTGHRPNRLGGYAPCITHTRVREWLYETIKGSGVKTWLWGGAMGVDQWGARIALDLGCEVRAYLPFPNMEVKWNYDTRKEFHSLLKVSSSVKCYSDEFSNKAYWIRDKAMVDDADVCVSVWNGATNGGTYITTQYALKEAHKPVYRYNPDTGETISYGMYGVQS